MVRCGIVAVTERGGDGAPVLNEVNEESFALVQPYVGIVFGDSTTEETGTLYITTRRLVWLSDDDKQKGYAVDFLSLTMHAISRDTEAYPSPCIYTQIENDKNEYEVDGEEEEEEAEAEAEEKTDLAKISEMRLVPRDPNTLENLFQVLCECAALNPDPEGEREGEGEWFFNAEEVMGGHIGADNGAEYSANEPDIEDPRFEDAENGEHDEK